HGPGRDEALRLVDALLAAMRIDAAERDCDVGVVDRELRDLIVCRVRAAGQRLLDSKDDAADLARTKVLGLRRPVARCGARFEALCGRFLGFGQRALVLEMDVHVERGQLGDVDTRSAHATAPLETMMTCAPGASAYRSSTSRARRVSTARWLIDPLS